MTPAALLTSVDVTHEAKTSPFATCPAAAGRPQPAQHQFRQQAAQPPATAAARASSSSSNSSSSSSSGSSVAFIQACRARRGAHNLKDAWRCKTQLQAQHPSPNGDSSCGPSTDTLPTVNPEQGQQGAVDELELALSGWLWDQEEDWPLDTTDQTEPELHCLDSCWPQEDARQQALDVGLPQMLSLTESAGQLREVLDHIFDDGPDAAPLAAPCSATTFASQPSAGCALFALLTTEAGLDAAARPPQDLNAPLSPLSCSMHTSAASAATATGTRAAEHMQQDDGVGLDLDLGLDLQRRWSELAAPANSSGVQSDFVQRWAELAPRSCASTGLKRRWSELPLEGVGAHTSSSSSKSPRLSLNLGTMHPTSPAAPPGCSGQDAQPNRPAAAQGMRTHSLPPLMAYLKQQQQQQEGQQGQQQVVQAASAEPWSRQRQPGAGRAAAAGASSPAPPAQQPKPFASCQAATLQSLLEWQALSHRVVSAAAAPDQATAWSLLTDAELQRFLSKTALKRPGGGGGDGGGGRQQMIDSIKQTVVSARAGGR